FDFWGFRKWVKKQVKTRKYDKFIILSTLDGIIISDVLKKYKGRYIFDIRDYSYENIPLFYKLEKNIIDRSAFTAISSLGFKAFLPDSDKYILAHNFNPQEAKNVTAQFRFNKEKPLNIVWNGTMRFFEHQKFIINALKNDERFRLIYHGAGPELEKYKEFCKNENVENIVFTGAYDNKDKAKLLADADVLNNSYGYGRYNVAEKELKYAVPNRYYDGMIYHIPQFVEINGHKCDIAESNGVGKGIAFDENFADNLYNYYCSIDAGSFDRACSATLNMVIDEDDLYIRKITEFIK
ncbi:MAG: hypothetical protein J6B23_10160, partial [Clostridia bacterium]|nr:hypothetical protein [Clostridia bacterium]